MKVLLVLSALSATILTASAGVPVDRLENLTEQKINPENGYIDVHGLKHLNGPETHPAWTVDYQHKLWQGKDGMITAGEGLQKLPGSRVEPQIGLQGSWRFKREANPQGGSIVIQGQKPLSGPERRPSWNVDYQHNIWQGKNGQISAGGGAQKLPGQRWEPQIGLQGSWRFKREANPQGGSIVIQGQKPLSGPERRPSWNVDYQHNIWQSKNGQISAGGGAQKLPGQRWEPQIGLQGSWRFKREANPQGGSIVIQGQKPLSGPERRPSWNVDYQHNIWQSKNGQISAGGGAQKLPGQRWEPQVGIQGSWRFKREANPGDNGSISFTHTKPLSGPERRPTYNFDYQHKVFNGKDGHFSIGGGGQRLPGGRWEPTVGAQGTWRF